MQSKQELEVWYSKEDPWGYETNPEDARRRKYILGILELFIPTVVDRALDIGAGEGFITRCLPSHNIDALEISDAAAARLPDNVNRVIKVEGYYDLILATGVLYKQYDWQAMIKIIENHAKAGTIVLTSHIFEMEVPAIKQPPFLNRQEFAAKFKYRNYEQALRVFKW